MKRDVGFPLLLFVVARSAYAILSFLGLSFDADMVEPVATGRLHADMLWLDGLCRWDCGWYLRIANEGYAELQMANFWPLFPSLIWLLVRVGVAGELAAVLISAAFQLLALLVLYRLFTRLTSERVARSALLLYVVYPYGFFQGVGYPEGALTGLTAAAVLAAIERKPAWVAVFLAAGLLARHLAVFAALAVVPILWLANEKSAPAWRRVLSLWPVLALPLTAALWNAYLEQRLGVQLAFVAARKQWGSMAYWSILDWNAGLISLKERVYVIVSMLLAIGAIPLLRERRLIGLGLMGLATSMLLWAIGLAALGRYSSSVWPLFLGWGLLAQRWPSVAAPVTALSLAVQTLFFVLFIHQWWIF